MIKTPDEIIQALEYLISGDCTDTQFDYSEEIEAAIEIIKESKKGCEYCNNTTEIGSCDSDAKMRIEKGNMHCLPYIVVENDTFGTSDIFDVEYCPHCGRKLVKS